MKIPIVRLKVAQIDKKTLPFSVLRYCMEHPAFVAVDDPQELFCHADIFKQYIDAKIEFLVAEKTVDVFNDLNKQFCSFDYIMII